VSPKAVDDATSERLRHVRRRDTAAELAVRRLVHARGLRYRVDVAPIAGIRRRADLVFTRAHVAVFIDGCFWHRCPIHGTEPKNNAEWWRAKLDANVARDRDTDRRLREAGWVVIRAWEHEAPTVVADRIEVWILKMRAKM
jgi:DNA mismatch endonuclease (patch repair protein)